MSVLPFRLRLLLCNAKVEEKTSAYSVADVTGVATTGAVAVGVEVEVAGLSNV